MSQLQGRRQGPSESVAAFAQDIEKLARQALPGAGPAAVDVVALQRLYDGLHNAELRKMVMAYPTTTMAGAVGYAVQAEATLARARGPIAVQAVEEVEGISISRNSAEARAVRPAGRGGRLGRPMLCFLCDQEGHMVRECPQQRCLRCQSLGHTVYNCPRRQQPGNEPRS